MLNNEIILSSIPEERWKEIFNEVFVNRVQSPPLPPPDNEILTDREVQSLLKVSKVTLKKWRDDGRIPYIRIGTRIRYSKQTLLDSLQSTKYGRIGK